MATTINEIRGYSLFNAVEDLTLRTYNRARVMKNMMQDHSDKEKNVSEKGSNLIYQYFTHIPEAERGAVHTKLAELLKTKDTE